MKVASKPISSPSRAEKYPPPLMRFLRSNVGNKSRGRSRSSPMFVRKKNAAIETQEPSSPKVTCIGQVRVRRSSKKIFSRSKSGRSQISPAKCSLPTTLFCNLPTPKFPAFSPVLRRWVSFFRFGCCKKGDFRTSSSKIESNRRTNVNAGESKIDYENQGEDEESQIEEPDEVFIASTLPKNAFLLTRCRSAPFRSSSLAGRFWGSPETNSDGGDEMKKSIEIEEGEREIKRPLTSENEASSSVNSVAEGRIDEEISGNGKESENLMITEKVGLGLPLILSRCKSLPAKVGEKLIDQKM